LTDIVKIDGSLGEGGGQILRTAITLSAITGRPIEVTNIRSKRPNPGLRPQHMTGIKIISDLFRANVENLRVGADWIRFAPRDKFEGGTIEVDIGTAGSISMVLAVVVPAVSLSGNSLWMKIVGGTDVRASPTFDYVKSVLARAYREIGIRFSVEVLKRGYYPKGGGIVESIIEPCRTPETIELLAARNVEPRIISVCSLLPRDVAERQTSSAIVALEKNGIQCRNYSASIGTSISPGSSILVYSTSDFGPFIGGDSIGEIGKRAEAVGIEAAERYLDSALNQAPVDPFLADMLVLPLALAKGRSKYKTARVTEHLKTNLEVAKQILGCEYGIEQIRGGNLVTIEN